MISCYFRSLQKPARPTSFLRFPVTCGSFASRPGCASRLPLVSPLLAASLRCNQSSLSGRQSHLRHNLLLGLCQDANAAEISPHSLVCKSFMTWSMVTYPILVSSSLRHLSLAPSTSYDLARRNCFMILIISRFLYMFSRLNLGWVTIMFAQYIF